MKNLIVLGDSWPAGNELEDAHHDCFPAIIKNILGFDNLINLSYGGSSLQHYFLQLKKFYTIKKLYPDTASYELLVCMTSSVRDLYFDDGGKPLEIIPTDSSKIEFYAKMFNYPETPRLFWYRTVFMLQNWARQNGIKDYYVQMFETAPLEHSYSEMVDFHPIYKEGKVSMTQFLTKQCGEKNDSSYDLHHGSQIQNESETYKKYISPNVSHPNKLGHQIIAEEIARFMRQ
jgi:hypothetical protein